MNSIFEENLGDLISLIEKKIINKKNKKIISTSIFLPENPSINIKTSVYILGLIKTVETFRQVMGDDWILRIYYDSIYDKGVTLKNIDGIVEYDYNLELSNVNVDPSTKSVDPSSNNDTN